MHKIVAFYFWMKLNIPFCLNTDNIGILLIAALISISVSLLRFYRPNHRFDVTMTTEEYNHVFWKDLRTIKYINYYQYSFPPVRYDYNNRHLSKKCGKHPLYEKFFSHERDDLFIYESFFHGTNLTGYKGTYVELGATDGLNESYTYFFDKCLGWKGLLIEKNPYLYSKLVVNRPLAHKMSFLPYCSKEYYNSNTSTHILSQLRINSTLNTNMKMYLTKQSVDIPCGPLGPILEHVFEREIIQFFSLDIDDAELMVLNTIDFSNIQINIFQIKIQNVSFGSYSENRNRISQKMNQLGYLKYDGLDPFSDIFVHSLSRYKDLMGINKTRYSKG